MAYTARQIMEGALVELNKINAPALLLSEFNYYINKAVSQVINKRYNQYDISQQSADDLRVLKSTAELPAKQVKYANKYKVGKTSMHGATYEVDLPEDYLHMLNCICIYRMLETYSCYNVGDYVQFPAKRLTADSWSMIMGNYYNNPKPERPYYYLHNINTSTEEPTAPYNEGGTDQYSGNSDLIIDNIRFKVISVSDGEVELKAVDSEIAAELYKAVDMFYTSKIQKPIYTFYYNPNVAGGVNKLTGAIELGQLYVKALDENGNIFKSFLWKYTSGSTLADAVSEYYISKEMTKQYRAICCTEEASVSSDEYPRTISLKGLFQVSTVDRPAYLRHANPSRVRCEIRYGKDSSVFELVAVEIDYIKAPQHIRLTQEQIDLTIDTSQILEFPDYICQEIINELVHLIMGKDGDQRLQTHIITTTSTLDQTPKTNTNNSN